MSDRHIIGIDVAKDSLVLYDLATQQTITLANSTQALTDALKHYGWNAASHLVALESTGDYSFLPMLFFSQQGFPVKLLNPIVTKKFIRATVRNKKTDKSDARAIAELAQHGDGYLISHQDLDIAKKSLLRLEQNLVKISSSLKKMKQSLLRKQSLGIPVAAAIASIDALIAATQTTARDIWSLAIAEPADQQEQIIASHIGCGVKLSAIISTEAGNIKRFPSAKQFKAYAGIDPKVHQSGNLLIHGRMTKRGNAYLRHALFLAAFTASMHDPQLKQYYQKKRAEQKSHTLAVCAVARKLCERIYSTVTQNRFYSPTFPEREYLT